VKGNDPNTRNIKTTRLELPCGGGVRRDGCLAVWLEAFNFMAKSVRENSGKDDVI
jgi:hypothetical protein